MKTIKEGNYNLINKIFYFSCRNCGWIGLANLQECNVEAHYNDTFYYVYCPYCAKRVNTVSYNSEEYKEIDKMVKENNSILSFDSDPETKWEITFSVDDEEN